MEKYDIDFLGYRLDTDVSTLPTFSGIYIVYRCIYSSIMKIVDIKELLYIGQATNIHDRLSNHEKKPSWEKRCSQDEVLCYAYANIAINDLDVVENGLIFMQKPIMNTDLCNDYIHPIPVAFEVTGKCANFFQTSFSIVGKTK
ncbi:MAG TPA: GIY-YIG nuclease family protein [Thomasclavelia ramosa]|nr:GIY-YIG nuclease family protein [Thomasclavelia ramosa]